VLKKSVANSNTTYIAFQPIWRYDPFNQIFPWPSCNRVWVLQSHPLPLIEECGWCWYVVVTTSSTSFQSFKLQLSHKLTYTCYTLS